ncbi:MAG: TetR/AcrR family transcriptional regulator [Siphonobacter sp.]
MGIQERKEREKQEMRNLIIEKAKQVFIEEGYDKTSIRVIADRIEYSPATIYLYFKDKDELLYAVHEIGFNELYEYMKPLEQIVNPLERLRGMGELYLQYAVKNPEMYDLMFISRAPMKSLFKGAVEGDWDCGFRVFNFLCSCVQESMDRGFIRKTDLAVATLSIWSFIHGLVSLHIRDRLNVFPEHIDIQQLIDQALNNLIELIKEPSHAAN